MRTLAALLLLVSSPALAAERVWISEFAALRVEAAAPIATLPTLVKQKLDVTNGVQSSAPFSPATKYIRVICEVQCAISASDVATPSSMLMPALRPEYFRVTPGAVLSVIAAP